jgi:adenylate cyclase
MKVSLRTVLLAVLLALVSGTVLVQAITGYLTSQATAHDLTFKVLDQTALAIDQQVRGLLLKADHHGIFTQRQFETNDLKFDDRASLARYFLRFMECFPEITGVFLGTEARGECLGVSRNDEGELRIWELRFNPGTDKLEIREYERGDFPGRPARVDLDGDRADTRQRPWYVDARKTGHQVWSRVYPFFRFSGVATVPGITCATPIYDNGTLAGVLGIDIRLDKLCGFLQTVRVGVGGIPFVVEVRSDGVRHVIAHPNPNILLRATLEGTDGSGAELVSPDEISDRRVTALMAAVPAEVGATAGPRSAQVRFRENGVPYLGVYHLLTGANLPNWLVCTIIPEDEVLARAWADSRLAAAVGASVLLAAVLLSLIVSRQITRPMIRLVEETRAVGNFRVEPRAPIPTRLTEVDHLAKAMEQMKTSLRSFGKYVPADLVRHLLASGKEARLGGESRLMTIFFCDLANFTTISESLSPQELVEALGEYFRILSEEIAAAGGTVDKFIGDAVMAFWGAPAEKTDHAAAACLCALACQRRLEELRMSWKAQNRPLLAARIGINSGPVVVGNIGSEQRFNYTVIGDAVNVASRLEGLNKYYRTSICLSEETYRAAAGAVIARPIDRVSVKGKSTPTLVYEVLASAADPDGDAVRLAELHERGLDYYQRREWAAAIAAFEEVLRLRPGDGPATELLRRCRQYELEPPGPDWNGMHRMESK